MGLDYLNKKVWHPGSMKNIQKVWEVEQQQKEINKRARQRAKKLLQEQHNDELKRIQVEAGLIPRSHLDRMEWMYDWGNKIGQQKTNEEFLTGKKQAKPGEKKEFKHVFQEEITNKKCQDFQLLHQDPMYEIMKHEKARRDAIVNNPIQMKNIIKEVERQYMPQDFQQRKQKHLSSRRRPSTSSSSSRSSSSSSSEQRRRKHKKNGKHRRQRSRSKERRERSRSRDSYKRSEQRSEKRKSDKSVSEKKSFKQSKIYQQYLKDRFGGILKQDQDGNYKPDYSVHKKKYKTQIQLDQEDRRRRIEELKQNAKKLQALREKDRKYERQDQKQQNFDSGVAKIRGEMFDTVRQNRNYKKYRGSDQD